ncbi:hypothetical protein CMI47_19490 [Candidatus Pacearchaeota archaeon]|nr:hypothetical protein [Candidatus Pacearchaeota archaeon]|tara:strand:- start:4829 stop:5101 length:273 start_codon:yes stop_codon:yes gene_type:complete
MQLPSKIISLFFVSSFTTAICDDELVLDRDRSIVYRDITEIDFEGLEVEGQLVRPQGALILDRRKGSFNPLIRLRTEFDEEINSSVNNIK